MSHGRTERKANGKPDARDSEEGQEVIEWGKAAVRARGYKTRTCYCLSGSTGGVSGTVGRIVTIGHHRPLACTGTES